jgi:MSHA biogenesis protein MshP
MNIFRFNACRSLRRSAGVGLVTAIFLLVVLSGLAVALVSISGAQNAASALDVQGARAYQAARAGIEWGLYQNRVPARLCPPLTSFALPGTTALKEFVVTVKCTVIAAPVGTLPANAAALVRYVIVANACNLQPANGSCPNPSNSPEYVERQIQVSM